MLLFLGVLSLHCKPFREYIGKFRSEAISPSSDLLLLVIVVAGCKQMPEYQLRHITSMLLMNLNRNAFAIVPDRYSVLLLVNRDLDRVGLLVSLNVVSRVYQYFI